MDWRSVLGENVRRLRRERELTQEQLAFEAQIDLTYVGGIERGRRNPSLVVIARLAAALGVSPPLAGHHLGLSRVVQPIRHNTTASRAAKNSLIWVARKTLPRTHPSD
jgi:transcriptional regulator with XRE-family HTH domain